MFDGDPVIKNYSLEIEGLVAHKHKLEAEIERLRAVITRYLEFAKDVDVSPVAPELKPIRDAMRAVIANGYK